MVLVTPRVTKMGRGAICPGLRLLRSRTSCRAATGPGVAHAAASKVSGGIPVVLRFRAVETQSLPHQTEARQ